MNPAKAGERREEIGDRERMKKKTRTEAILLPGGAV